MKGQIICISAGEWEGIKHRPHHFMEGLARSGWQVIYLEPPATLIAPLKNKKMLKRWINWLKGLRRAEDNLYILAPPPALPFGNNCRLINKINQWLAARTIKKALKHWPQAPLLYSFLPNAVDLLPYLKPLLLVYDCVDDHGAFTGLLNPTLVYQMEKELLSRTDLAFATAERLLEERKEWCRPFYLVPNGAEYEHFAAGDGEVPADLRDIPHPLAGFIGGISDWIDISLLAQVARLMPAVSFVLIGPAATDVSSLRELPNVRLLGPKPYSRLPAYLQHFDTCLIPFKINKLTESVNPIKLFEYLSAGKPVVSTPLPEVCKYSDVVEIAGDAEGFRKAIEKTMAEAASPEAAALEAVRRKEVGRNNSWAARCRAVQDYLAEALERREPQGLRLKRHNLKDG